MSLIKYTKRFKELIRKAGVEGTSATYQFGQGLTSKEYKKIALTNPTKLEEWYEAAHHLYNIKNQNGVVTSTQSEWDMDVDVIAVNAMSRDESFIPAHRAGRRPSTGARLIFIISLSRLEPSPSPGF